MSILSYSLEPVIKPPLLNKPHFSETSIFVESQTIVFQLSTFPISVQSISYYDPLSFLKAIAKQIFDGIDFKTHVYCLLKRGRGRKIL